MKKPNEKEIIKIFQKQLGNKKFVLSLDTSIAIEKYITKRGGTVKR